MTGWCCRGSGCGGSHPGWSGMSWELRWKHAVLTLCLHCACCAYVVHDARAAHTLCTPYARTAHAVHTHTAHLLDSLHAGRARQPCACSGFPCVSNIPVSGEGFPSQVFNEYSTYNRDRQTLAHTHYMCI